uniref:LIM zinc-binding domain-containing protein n=1 Tax=Meloidogyne enterolobii TaxID=390850 RepID=A0A6V7WWG6_MELEN|nr:unnamed protein product [Meloidogyne enterolobii]
MNFGLAEYVPKDCPLCGVPVQLADRLTVDRETIHKACFKCCFCACNLEQGAAAMERSFYERYGPRWYCRGTAGKCSLLPNSKKEEKLKEKGLAERKIKNKK